MARQEKPIEIRDLPQPEALDTQQMEEVAGGIGIVMIGLDGATSPPPPVPDATGRKTWIFS